MTLGFLPVSLRAGSEVQLVISPLLALHSAPPAPLSPSLPASQRPPSLPVSCMLLCLPSLPSLPAAHSRPHDQNLFGIVQGGLDPKLRDICLKGLIDRDLPGYAIGGLAGGEDKESFWRVVAQCTAALPANKPRYVMGVGYPLDIVVCSALGADMYDCVYPTRTARFGTALIPEGVLKLKHAAMANDHRPIDPSCSCLACRSFSRAYLHSLVTKDPVGCHLLTIHNIAYMMQLTRSMHNAILNNTFPSFVVDFLQKQFPRGDVPQWVQAAMQAAAIDISPALHPARVL
ncbi:unnamed protein product [Closterium sp. Naga37s-1]|nr:unnamed protein product [Closterium sp. Naga37s-1]